MNIKFYFRILILFMIVAVLFACGSPASTEQAPQPTATQLPQATPLAYLPGGHTTTQWDIEPNMAMDALCFFTTLTGDPFYLKYYQADYDRFSPRLTPEVKKAVGEIKAIIEQNKDLMCPVLSQLFVPLEPKTLDDLIQAVNNPETIRQGLELPADSEDWHQVMSQMQNLRSVLTWMKEAGFDTDYQERYFPQIEAKANRLTREVSGYNIIPMMEAALGFALPSDKITIYLSHYVQPFGIGTGPNQSILLDDSDSKFIITNAIHENLHLLDIQEPALWEALNTLQQDDYYMKNFQSHNLSLGYNKFEDYMEEDIVEALGQYLAEKVNGAEDTHQLWSQSPAGLNILSPVVYSLLKQENYSPETETYHDFLIRMVREGKLKAGMIENANRQFYKSSE